MAVDPEPQLGKLEKIILKYIYIGSYF